LLELCELGIVPFQCLLMRKSAQHRKTQDTRHALSQAGFEPSIQTSSRSRP